MAGEIRRENFADEASWLEFQHNQLELARHKRQRELAEQYAKAGRDYGIIKRINARVKAREYTRKWRADNHGRWLAQLRTRYASDRAYAEVMRERSRLYQRRRYSDPVYREYLKRKWRAYNQSHKEQRRAAKRNRRALHPDRTREREREYQRCKVRYASDPEYRAKVLARSREYYARKRAEKLAQEQANG